MNNIWFTSDTHFGHTGIIKYCMRPFATMEEMDETIISNWNAFIKPTDTVYHLGDFAFGKVEQIEKYRNRINGKINIVWGNHDYKNKIQRISHRFTSCSDLKVININKHKITLCHYCMNTFDASHYDAWHLFGHSHGTWKATGKRIDVGQDCWKYTPVNYDTIEIIMNTLPHNDNWVERLPGYDKELQE